MQFENWLAFCSIAFIAAAIPGPAILLVSTHALQFSTLRSLITVAGNVSGLFMAMFPPIVVLLTPYVYRATDVPYKVEI